MKTALQYPLGWKNQSLKKAVLVEFPTKLEAFWGSITRFYQQLKLFHNVLLVLRK